MKKLVNLIGLLLAVGGAMAQDTVVSIRPKPGYFYNYWCDTLTAVVVQNFPQYTVNGGGTERVVTAKYHETKDPLVVYGIAAALMEDRFRPSDTSYDNVYEYLNLYLPVADTLQVVGDSLKVHLRDTPVSYYWDLSMPSIGGLLPNRTVAMYERYFDTPVTVTDSFYAGITQRTWAQQRITSGPDSGMYGPAVTSEICLMGCWWGDWWDVVYPGKVVFKVPVEGGYQYIHWTATSIGLKLMWDPFIFPIFTPPDTVHGGDTIVVGDTIFLGGDTIVVGGDTIILGGGDTVSLVDVRLLERYVGVLPNPAAGRVTVTSSFGLREIEIYNAAGNKVMARRAAGYSAILDIGELPVGPYLVRVKTPGGTVTKKLVVRRE
ncbi:MAG: T9SS type A sorting domain-containing protein [Bacteroidales bacterium]|nr:T9SS type A sorting domain-containing protein [Bacteroidales bacterium]